MAYSEILAHNAAIDARIEEIRGKIRWEQVRLYEADKAWHRSGLKAGDGEGGWFVSRRLHMEMQAVADSFLPELDSLVARRIPVVVDSVGRAWVPPPLADSLADLHV